MNNKKLKIIKDIEAQVPKEWRDALLTEVYVAPDLRDEAINSLQEYVDAGETDTKEYKRLKNLFDAGYYDAKEVRVDEDMSKKIEDFVEAGIDEAINAGRLPKPKNDKEFNDYINKIKQNERKTTKRRIRTKQEAERSGS